jgi:hypothetical protein
MIDRIRRSGACACAVRSRDFVEGRTKESRPFDTNDRWFRFYFPVKFVPL